MVIKMPTIHCQWCGDRIPENRVEIRRIKVPGVAKKQRVHNTDHCSLLSSTFTDEQTKRQNCYRRHQDFIKRINDAMDSDNPKLRKFARKCLWNLIERKASKYLNQQLKAIDKPVGEEIVFKKFRWFCIKPMVVQVQ